jgi:hypothetical protein
MKRFKILFVLIAVLTISTTTSFAAGGGKHKATKQTAVKENKKFADDAFFDFNGGDVTNPARWTSDPNVATNCVGTSVLCGISFNSTQYPLVNNKPSSTFLTNEVAVHQTGSSP